MQQQTLCDAIRARVQVRFRHDDDIRERLFNPHVVYYSTQRNVLCGGVMISNPNKPSENGEWRTPKVLLLRSLFVTDITFTPEPDFDPLNKVYRHGIICHVLQNLR